jgi:rifampin ADP-ribosylating transferase
MKRKTQKQELMTTEKSKDNKTSGQSSTPFAQTYFHGTKADLKIGDLIEAGFNSNYGRRKNAKYIFLSATLDAAI